MLVYAHFQSGHFRIEWNIRGSQTLLGKVSNVDETVMIC